jgi:hypothetical protein
VLLLAAALPACGKKGNPLPPLQIVPARVTDLTASVAGDRIELQFTAPAANPEDPTSVAASRVEVYRADSASDIARAPGEDRFLRAVIVMRGPDAPAPPPTATNPQPAPGERATFVERIDPSAADESWTYVAVSVVGRNRRGPASPAVTVPLTTRPPPPEGLTGTHDETHTTLSWQPGGTAYRVFSVDRTGEPAPDVLLTPKPLAEARFQQPVEFGAERCFVVRSVQVTGAVLVEGLPSERFCLVAADRYPPPRPSNLRVIQEGSAITLNWTPVEAPDLAGYVVLRGDADGVSMQPLARDPVRETTFKDAGVQPGSTYTYSVYAVDNAPTPNVSQQSDRQVVTVR